MNTIFSPTDLRNAVQPIRGDEGADILGPTNPARQAQARDRLAPPSTDHGTIPNLKWSFADSHNKLEGGGWARQTTMRELPVATKLACVNMRLEAGVIREMHWHKPAEWAYMIKGRARVTAVDDDGRTFQADVGEGDLWNFPTGIPHSIQGLAGEGCEFLLVFDDGNFNEDETFLVTDFLAHIPKAILAKNFGVQEAAFANIPKAYNARQGSEPGSVFYGFISDRFASYYSRVIAAAASEAPYVLDGLMHHESAVEIHEHTTDTAGAVESIFALAHAFGYHFAPRIRDLGERKLYVTDRSMADGLPGTVFGGVINRAAIEQNWDEVLRLGASVRAGTVPPSVILKKLAAFPRQNALHRALREMGRLEWAIFTCDWLLDPELRRRSNSNLNKGESRHALARAVFFHRLGELRDRTAEDMAHRASGLNLVVNAIVLWNTTYLARAVAYVRSQGIELTDEELSHVAPLRWDHIALTGDYLWSDVEVPRERFRSLRTTRFRPEAFRASLAA